MLTLRLAGADVTHPPWYPITYMIRTHDDDGYWQMTENECHIDKLVICRRERMHDNDAIASEISLDAGMSLTIADPFSHP